MVYSPYVDSTMLSSATRLRTDTLGVKVEGPLGRQEVRDRDRKYSRRRGILFGERGRIDRIPQRLKNVDFRETDIVLFTRSFTYTLFHLPSSVLCPSGRVLLETSLCTSVKDVQYRGRGAA